MLHLTPEIMEAAYEILRITPPFRRWKLPDPDEVVFVVCSNNDRVADYEKLPNGTHKIRINVRACATLACLVRFVAHEMTHLYVDTHWPNVCADHGRHFMAAATKVCRYHGWNVREFAW